MRSVEAVLLLGLSVVKIPELQPSGIENVTNLNLAVLLRLYPLDVLMEES